MVDAYASKYSGPGSLDSGFAFGLTRSDIEEFRAIMREECGEDLSVAEAWARASELLSLFKLFLDRELNRQRGRGGFEHRSP